MHGGERLLVEVGKRPFEPWRSGFYALKVRQEKEALGDLVCLVSNDTTGCKGSTLSQGLSAVATEGMYFFIMDPFIHWRRQMLGITLKLIILVKPLQQPNCTEHVPNKVTVPHGPTMFSLFYVQWLCPGT